MADRFSRTNFFQQNIIDGVLENDVAFNDFQRFKFKKRRSFYTLRTSDIGRPDLISLRVYGSMNYWWVICKLNNIEDIFNDMSEGQVLMLPSIDDVNQFYMDTNRDKRKK